MLKNLLSEHKPAILRRWFNLIVETYPSDASALYRREKDQFLNPVGYTIARQIEIIYDELFQGMNRERLSLSLDDIARIRAVQEFSPSQALVFVFLLKKAMREELDDEIRRDVALEELLEFESRIDELALLAFDAYVKCREKIYDIRANELRDRSKILLERMNLMYGTGWQNDLGEVPTSDNAT